MPQKEEVAAGKAASTSAPPNNLLTWTADGQTTEETHSPPPQPQDPSPADSAAVVDPQSSETTPNLKAKTFPSPGHTEKEASSEPLYSADKYSKGPPETRKAEASPPALESPAEGISWTTENLILNNFGSSGDHEKEGPTESSAAEPKAEKGQSSKEGPEKTPTKAASEGAAKASGDAESQVEQSSEPAEQPPPTNLMTKALASSPPPKAKSARMTAGGTEAATEPTGLASETHSKKANSPKRVTLHSPEKLLRAALSEAHSTVHETSEKTKPPAPEKTQPSLNLKASLGLKKAPKSAGKRNKPKAQPAAASSRKGAGWYSKVTASEEAQPAPPGTEAAAPKRVGFGGHVRGGGAEPRPTVSVAWAPPVTSVTVQPPPPVSSPGKAGDNSASPAVGSEGQLAGSQSPSSRVTQAKGQSPSGPSPGGGPARGTHAWYSSVTKADGPASPASKSPHVNLMSKTLMSPPESRYAPSSRPEVEQSWRRDSVATGPGCEQRRGFGGHSRPPQGSPGSSAQGGYGVPSRGMPQSLFNRRSAPELQGLSCCEDSSPDLSQEDQDAAGREGAGVADLRLLCARDWGGAKFVDSHCHLDFLFARNKCNWSGSFAEFRRTEKWAQWFGPAFGGVVMDLCEPRTWMRGGSAKWDWEGVAAEAGVWTAVGCHPHYSASWSDAVGEEMRHLLLTRPGFVAVGECGLDYSGNNDVERETQQRAFRAQATLAKELGKPLVIHCRGARFAKGAAHDEAEEECLALLEDILGRGSRLPIHRHCFQGSVAWARRWVDAFPNIRFGMNPNISRTAPELVRGLEVERMLIETDSPYFLPRELKGGSTLRFCAPAFGIVVAQEIATLKRLPVPDVLRRVMDNFAAVYGVRPN